MLAGSVCPCVMFVLCLLLCWAVGLLNVGMATFSNSVFFGKDHLTFQPNMGRVQKVTALSIPVSFFVFHWLPTLAESIFIFCLPV